MPIEIFEKVRKRIKPTWKTAVISVFVFGLAAHFYRMTNWLPNWDSLVFRDAPQHMESLGRWFLPYASKISSDFELPWLNGLLALIYIAVAVVLLCETLGIKSRLSAAVLAGLTVTFPTVISTFTYCYVADAYELAFLFVCLAVFLITKKGKIAAVVGTVLLALSMGIYQAYITFAIAIITCVLITGLLEKDSSAVSSLKKALKYAVCGIVAFGLYYAIQAAIMKFGGVVALDYQDFSQTLSMKEISPLTAAPEALYSFFRFFIDFSDGFNLYSALNIVVFVFLAICYLYAIIKNVRGGKIPLAILYIVTIPFGCAALYFINSNLDYHTLMKMSFSVVYIYFVLIYENIRFKNGIIEKIKSWAIPVICGLLIFSGICTANIAYHKLQMSFEKSYGILIRISDKIEALDGYENAKKILVVGHLENSEAYEVNFPPKITGTTDGLIIRKDDETVHQSVLTSALKDYCDISLEFLAGKEAAEMKGTDTVKNMPCWPKNGSVEILDDTVIVKLGEE